METTYEIHPAAELFPMMSDEELQLLADDIREQGLLEPIAIFENKILDGRNRLKACGMAEVQPKFKHLNGECKSPLLYVAAKNVLRRQLSTAQRAAIAAEMKPLLMEEAKQRQIASQFHEKSNDKSNEIRSASRDAKAHQWQLGQARSDQENAKV